MALALGAFGLGALQGSAFAAERRVALVIGNAAYKNFSTLKNPTNDAQGVAEALKKIGFDVKLATNVDEVGFIKVLRDFSLSAKNADAVLFYFAGHGVEEQRVGYLLPTNVEADEVRNPDISLLPTVDTVARAMSVTRGPKILIIDACRDDPTARDLAVGNGIEVRNVSTRTISETDSTRSSAQGGRVEGMLVVYSTAAKQVAYDGVGDRGPFAASFIRHLGEQGISVNELFHKVNADVLKETDNQQRTSFNDSLSGSYKLNLAMDDELAWRKLRDSDSTDPEQYEKFVEKYKNSAHAAEAAAFRDLLRKIVKERDDRIAVEESDWSEAKKSRDPDAVGRFIDKHPGSSHIAEAGKLRDSLKQAAAEAAAWAAARKSDTVTAYDEFAARYPASAHRGEEIKLRAEAAETAAWDSATKQNTPDGFKIFAEAHPGSAHKAEALRLREQILAALAEAAAWKKASSEKTSEGFNRFALQHPASEHAAEALRLRDEIRAVEAETAAWGAASRSNTPTGYEQFAAAFPKSVHADEALRKRDELRAAELAAAEKRAWASAYQADNAQGYEAFIKQYPQSAHLEEAHKRLEARVTADKAKADAVALAAAKAQACKREGEALKAQVAAHADPAEFQSMLETSVCESERPAVEAALAASQKAKDVAACAADKATLGKNAGDLTALRAGLVGMTCEHIRQQTLAVVARLEEADKRAKEQAEAKALEARHCEASGRAFDEIDLYAPSARDSIVALRDKATCKDPAFAKRVNQALAELTGRVQTAQKELARLNCYSGRITGVFDEATLKAAIAAQPHEGEKPDAAVVNVRLSPEFLDRLRKLNRGDVCGPGPTQTAPTSPPVAKATEPKPAVPASVVAKPKEPSHAVTYAHREQEHKKRKPATAEPTVMRQARTEHVSAPKPHHESAPRPAAQPATTQTAGPRFLLLPN